MLGTNFDSKVENNQEPNGNYIYIYIYISRVRASQPASEHLPAHQCVQDSPHQTAILYIQFIIHALDR